MDEIYKALGGFFLAAVILLAAGLILSWPVMILWNNCLVDAIVGLQDISWAQALGITVLARLLFNGN